MGAILLRLLPVFLWLAAMLAPPVAQAQSCTVTPNGPVQFGLVDVLLNAPVDIAANVSVQCTGNAGSTVRVCLNLSDPNGGAAGLPRRAVSGADILAYQFYSDAARSVKWGSWKDGGTGVEVLVPINAAGTSTPQMRTLYGRVFGGQPMVKPGTYSASFAGGFTHWRASYTATGQPCPALTQGSQAWPFSMRAIVPAKCTIGTANLAFGAPASLASPIDASTNLALACSNGLPYQIQLGTGGFASATPLSRRMTRGAAFVTYALYRDAARLQPWGWTLGSDTFSGTGTGLALSLPVHGRVPAQATPPPGLYADTLVISVIY